MFARRHVRRRRVGSGILQSALGEAIQMTGWAANGRIRLPLRLEEFAVRESNQDGIQRARRKANLQAQFIAVAPTSRVGRQSSEDIDRLGRWTTVANHP